jgi:hypothetical protein
VQVTGFPLAVLVFAVIIAVCGAQLVLTTPEVSLTTLKPLQLSSRSQHAGSPCIVIALDFVHAVLSESTL